jgi:hypothetical protein
MEARRQTTLARVRWQAAKHNEFVERSSWPNRKRSATPRRRLLTIRARGGSGSAAASKRERGGPAPTWAPLIAHQQRGSSAR